MSDPIEFAGIPASDMIPLDALDLPSRVAGKKIGIQTIWRWHRKGLKGGRIKLQATKIGGSVRTCRQWIAEFFAAINAADNPTTESKPARTPTQRQRDAGKARAELDKAMRKRR